MTTGAFVCALWLNLYRKSENIHVQIQSERENIDIARDFKDDSTNLDMSKSIHVLPWEKARIREQAEELFYISVAAKIDPETLSMQTTNLYAQISKDHGREYAAALFLLLLPKARDNPTGYISSAFKQGAEPTAASIAKVREIWELLDALLKAPAIEEIRSRIKEATDTDDTETLITLTRQQAQVKTALRMLSWEGTVEGLVEKREGFVASLLRI
jgi:hypothetical protein